jgi:hypothetical protein
MFGKDETEKLPPEAYTREVSEKIYAALGKKARTVVAAGHSAIVDAVFATPHERSGLTEIARQAGTPLHGLFLTADLDVRIARVGARSGDASDADARVATAQQDYDLGRMEWTIVDANGDPDETLRRAWATLRDSAGR